MKSVISPQKNPTELRQLRATEKENKPTSSLAVRNVHISYSLLAWKDNEYSILTVQLLRQQGQRDHEKFASLLAAVLMTSISDTHLYRISVSDIHSNF